MVVAILRLYLSPHEEELYMKMRCSKRFSFQMIKEDLTVTLLTMQPP